MKKAKYGSVLRMCWNQYFDYKNRFPYASAADIYTVIHDKMVYADYFRAEIKSSMYNIFLQNFFNLIQNQLIRRKPIYRT